MNFSNAERDNTSSTTLVRSRQSAGQRGEPRACKNASKRKRTFTIGSEHALLTDDHRTGLLLAHIDDASAEFVFNGIDNGRELRFDTFNTPYSRFGVEIEFSQSDMIAYRLFQLVRLPQMRLVGVRQCRFLVFRRQQIDAVNVVISLHQVLKMTDERRQ